MPADAARSVWDFVCSADGTWKWRFAEGESGPFSSLDVAFSNATSHGFDPFIHAWTSTADGRTTYYETGKAPVSFPEGKDPRK